VIDFLTLCEKAARAGAETLVDWIGRFQVEEKGPADLVTEADAASQEAIRRVLMAAVPDHGFVGEEKADPVNVGAEYCWVADPLDGTTNYVHRVPHYAVSLALVHRGLPIVGVVLDPISEESYSAARGEGATLNGQPIRTSDVQDLSQALIAASFSARITADSPEIEQFTAALLNCQAVRRTGSAALNLAYVAAGRFDGFWAQSTKSWDVAAGVLLVEEAGGVVTLLDGSPFDLKVPHPVASANKKLHDQFRTLLANARQ
jgi:myo-inositol-1(or 4)-monophosphatase